MGSPPTPVHKTARLINSTSFASLTTLVLKTHMQTRSNSTMCHQPNHSHPLRMMAILVKNFRPLRKSPRKDILLRTTLDSRSNSVAHRPKACPIPLTPIPPRNRVGSNGDSAGKTIDDGSCRWQIEVQSFPSRSPLYVTYHVGSVIDFSVHGCSGLHSWPVSRKRCSS